MDEVGMFDKGRVKCGAYAVANENQNEMEQAEKIYQPKIVLNEIKIAKKFVSGRDESKI